MPTLYLHKLEVIVMSCECSPDAIVERVEHAFMNRADLRAEETINATVEPQNRAYAPCYTIPDRPDRTKFDAGKAGAEAYFAALDEWRDLVPSASEKARTA